MQKGGEGGDKQKAMEIEAPSTGDKSLKSAALLEKHRLDMPSDGFHMLKENAEQNLMAAKH